MLFNERNNLLPRYLRRTITILPRFYIVNCRKHILWHTYMTLRTFFLGQADVTYGTALTRTLVLPVWEAFTSTRNQIYAWDTSASILPCVSFDFRSFTENFFLSKLFLILLHCFFIFGWKQYSKEHEQKRWETRRRRAGEIAFVYQNNKRNESITLASK